MKCDKCNKEIKNKSYLRFGKTLCRECNKIIGTVVWNCYIDIRRKMSKINKEEMISCYECKSAICKVKDAVKIIMAQLYKSKMFEQGDEVQKCFAKIYIDCKLKEAK